MSAFCDCTDLEFPSAILHLFQSAPCILQFYQKQPCTHLGIIASPVVLPIGYLELVAEIVQAVAAEVVELAGGTEGAILLTVDISESRSATSFVSYVPAVNERGYHFFPIFCFL